MKIIKNIIISIYNLKNIFLTYKYFTQKEIKDLSIINIIFKFLAAIDISGSFHLMTKCPMCFLWLLFKMFIVTIIIFILAAIYLEIIYWLSKFRKGDNIICPHYKKTYYFNNGQYSNYDFQPYFDQIKNELQKNQKKDYYLWVFSYDKNKKITRKAEFFCVYKTGIKKSLLMFDSKNFIYWERKKGFYCIQWLIDCRLQELLLMTEFYLKELPDIFTNENITQRIYDGNDLLGYNLNIGDIRYQILIINSNTE